jgi:hypothetical protein
MEQEPNKVLPLGVGPSPGEELPYRIELRDAAAGETVERVLARALSAPLARAMFKAALTEYPDRRITLCRGGRIMADSRKE